MTPEQLAERRKALGLSQYALAKALGVHRSTVKRWEAGDVFKAPIPRWLDLALRELARARTEAGE